MTTFDLYLYEELEGVKSIKAGTHVLQCFMIPLSSRIKFPNKVDSLLSEELTGHFVYLLIDDWEDTTKVYIGESKSFTNRIRSHESDERKSWRVALVFSSTEKSNSSMNSEVAQYIESRLIQQVNDSSRAQCTNRNAGKGITADNRIITVANTLLEDILLYVKALGFRFLDSDIHEVDTDVYSASVDGFESTGSLSENGFILYSGSKLRKDLTKTAPKSVAKLRNEQIEQNNLEDRGNHYLLKKDIEFNSPSAASGFALGRATNGREIWKDKNGQSLNDKMRKS